jgi:hypothetical protein
VRPREGEDGCCSAGVPRRFAVRPDKIETKQINDDEGWCKRRNEGEKGGTVRVTEDQRRMITILTVRVTVTQCDDNGVELWRETERVCGRVQDHRSHEGVGVGLLVGVYSVSVVVAVL